MKKKSFNASVISLLGIVAGLIFSVTATAQENYRNPITVEYCDLVRNPEKYYGKQVSFRATYRYGFEWEEIFCLDCRNTGKTWLEIDTDNITRKSRKILRTFPKDDGTINARFTGSFEEYGVMISGFGRAQYKLVLKEISEAEILSRSGGDPAVLPAKVRRKICGGESAPER